MADNYERIYGALQKEFDLAEVDASSIVGYITATRQIGRRTIVKEGQVQGVGISMKGYSKIQTFANEVAEAREIYYEVTDAEDSDTITDLRQKSARLSTHAEGAYGKQLNDYFNARVFLLSGYASSRKIFEVLP